MIAAHTPGPWITDGKEILEAADARSGCGVAKINRLHDEHEANGHLMAASPDMLAVLRQLEWSGRQLEVGVARCPLCGQHEGNPHTPACSLGAAIAKATGAKP